MKTKYTLSLSKPSYSCSIYLTMKKQLALLFFVLQSLSSSAVDLIGGVQYGETEEVVTKKLKASKFVTAELDDTIFGRVGINGSFTTTNTLNNLTFSLFFDWDHSNSNKNLKHINFRSEPLSTESYDTTLRASWKRGQTLLNALSWNR